MPPFLAAFLRRYLIMMLKLDRVSVPVSKSFYHWTVVGFISLFLSSAYAVPWTIQSLTQTKSEHTGPNCYNATLLAKGFMDQKQYVDGMEFFFYIENFCQPQTKNPLATGNVLLAFGSDLSSIDSEAKGPVVLHSAVSMGNDQLFEKATAYAGTYDIKKINESLFYGAAGEENGTSERVSYMCTSSDKVRAKISKLNADPLANRITSFKAKFVKSVFEQGIGLDKHVVTKESEDLTKLLAARVGRGEADLYLVAISRSWLGTVESYVKENQTLYDQATVYSLVFLKEAVAELAERIRMQTKKQRTLKFLDRTDVW